MSSHYFVTNDVYRAVILIRGPGNVPTQQFVGPYDKVGTAKGQVTRHRKGNGSFSKHVFIDGWVEVANNWERVE